MNQIVYIIATIILRNLFKLIPVKVDKNQILFTSYLGSQYSCNPKYLSIYISKNYPEYHLIWAFNDIDKFKYLEKQNIELVKYNSFKFIIKCLSSKYIITNTRDMSHIPFRKNQVVLNTWHGGGAYKCVGNSVKKQPIDEHFREKIYNKMPLTIVSSSQKFSELTIKKSFHHNGPIINSGMPRNDMLINGSADDINHHVRNILNIDEYSKICLYAPTYRDGKDINEYKLDIDLLKKTLSDKFGGEWVILYRTHYYVKSQIIDSNIIDASYYPDMQELLCAADVLITDYSSSIWDYSFTYKPCFLYATDVDFYIKTNGFYYDIHTWPFMLAENMQELVVNIINYGTVQNKELIDNHHKMLRSYENGNACRVVCDALHIN